MLQYFSAGGNAACVLPVPVAHRGQQKRPVPSPPAARGTGGARGTCAALLPGTSAENLLQRWFLTDNI